MVRSTLKPGPYEGQKALDRDGRVVGEITGLDVTGQHVDAVRVRLDDGREVPVPRDWFQETTREGIQLARGGEDVRALES